MSPGVVGALAGTATANATRGMTPTAFDWFFVLTMLAVLIYWIFIRK